MDENLGLWDFFYTDSPNPKDPNEALVGRFAKLTQYLFLWCLFPTLLLHMGIKHIGGNMFKDNALMEPICMWTIQETLYLYIIVSDSMESQLIIQRNNTYSRNASQ